MIKLEAKSFFDEHILKRWPEWKIGPENIREVEDWIDELTRWSQDEMKWAAAEHYKNEGYKKPNLKLLKKYAHKYRIEHLPPKKQAWKIDEPIDSATDSDKRSVLEHAAASGNTFAQKILSRKTDQPEIKMPFVIDEELDAQIPF